MDHLFFLTDVGGPRLTASPGQRAAADWAIARLKSWGIDERAERAVGPLRPQLAAQALRRAPAHADLRAAARCPARVVRRYARSRHGGRGARAGLRALRGFAARGPGARRGPRPGVREAEARQAGRPHRADRAARELPPATAAALSRFDDADLAKLAAAPEPEPLPPLEWPVTKLPDDPKERQRVLSTLPLEAAEDYWTRQTRAWDPLWTFLREEGVPAVLVNDAYGRDAGGTLFAEQAGFWRAGSPVPPPGWCWPPRATAASRASRSSSIRCGSSSRSRSRCRRRTATPRT